MARDRQRAKQRKARRSQNPGPPPSEPHRSNVPGELDHASGEVEQFEAALIAGADGRPADEPEDATPPEVPVGSRARDRDDEDGDEEHGDEVPSEDELAQAAVAAAGGLRTDSLAPGPVPTRRGPGRFAAFLRASWAELQRVQWPDRRQVGQATAVVLGFVVVAGAYLGVADWVAQLIVDLVI